MAIFESVGAAAAIGGGLGLIGGMQRNDAAAAEARSAQTFSAQQYATRYQTQVKDMEAAGLNPMLAYSQGPGSAPTGVAAPVENVGSAASVGASQGAQAAIAAKTASAQIANVEADTSNKQAQADLIHAQIGSTTASANQSNAQVGLINANVDKIREEIKNVPLEGKRLIDAAWLLKNQADSTYQQTLTGPVQRQVMQATIRKLVAEGTLTEKDVEAAASWDNAGRITKEIKPFIDLIRMVLRK